MIGSMKKLLADVMEADVYGCPLGDPDSRGGGRHHVDYGGMYGYERGR